MERFKHFFKPGAKVKFNQTDDYTENMIISHLNKFKHVTCEKHTDILKEVFTKFWTITQVSGHLIYIDLSEHFPDIKDNPGFYYYRFDQVKVYLSST